MEDDDEEDEKKRKRKEKEETNSSQVLLGSLLSVQCTGNIQGVLMSAGA